MRSFSPRIAGLRPSKRTQRQTRPPRITPGILENTIAILDSYSPPAYWSLESIHILLRHRTGDGENGGSSRRLRRAAGRPVHPLGA